MPSEYRKWGSQASHPPAVDLPMLTLFVPQNEEECTLSLKRLSGRKGAHSGCGSSFIKLTRTHPTRFCSAVTVLGAG